MTECISVKFSEGLGIFDNHYGYPEIDDKEIYDGSTGRVVDIQGPQAHADRNFFVPEGKDFSFEIDQCPYLHVAIKAEKDTDTCLFLMVHDKKPNDHINRFVVIGKTDKGDFGFYNVIKDYFTIKDDDQWHIYDFDLRKIKEKHENYSFYPNANSIRGIQFYSWNRAAKHTYYFNSLICNTEPHHPIHPLQKEVIPRVRRERCRVSRRSNYKQLFKILKDIPGVNPKYFHKPKVPTKVKLSCLCDTIPSNDSVSPQVFHILRRYLNKQEAGNEFEAKIFTYLDNLSSKDIDALKIGLETYDKIPASKRSCLFKEEFLDWSIEKPIDPNILAKVWLNEGLQSARLFSYGETTCNPGKVRPWERWISGNPDIPSYKVMAPWPWFNSINGLRTGSHRKPLDLYLPQEYQTECTYTLNQETNEVIAKCENSMWPSCEEGAQTSKVKNQWKYRCLRVPEARAGQTAELIGFNFFTENCKVKLRHIEKPYEYMLDDVTVCGDSKTPVYDSDGVIADHRVTDHLSFRIPEKAPDGLHEFVPGVYLVEVIVPNEFNYTLADGSKPKEFTSNTASLKILPPQGLKYRIWVDKGHCYKETDGEWSSDEIYLKAIPVAFNMVGDNLQKLEFSSSETQAWSDADEGETFGNWDWRIVGEPGQPFTLNGVLAIGLIGYEVDSEDALKDQVKSFGDAYIQYLEKIWKLLSAAGAIGLAVGAIKKSIKWGLIGTGIALVVIFLVGLIWAAWAPADRILIDVIVLSEEDLFFLTSPLSPLPAKSAKYIIPDYDILQLFPESKLGYQYVEERRYRSHSEGSEYGLWFVYKRDV